MTGESLIRLWAKQILLGRKRMEQVPPGLKTGVRAALEEQEAAENEHHG